MSVIILIKLKEEGICSEGLPASKDDALVPKFITKNLEVVKQLQALRTLMENLKREASSKEDVLLICAFIPKLMLHMAYQPGEKKDIKIILRKKVSSLSGC